MFFPLCFCIHLALVPCSAREQRANDWERASQSDPANYSRWRSEKTYSMFAILSWMKNSNFFEDFSRSRDLVFAGVFSCRHFEPGEGPKRTGFTDKNTQNGQQCYILKSARLLNVCF